MWHRINRSTFEWMEVKRHWWNWATRKNMPDWTWTLLALDKLIDSLNQSDNFGSSINGSLDHRVLTCWLVRLFRLILCFTISKSFLNYKTLFMCAAFCLCNFLKSIFWFMCLQIKRSSEKKKQKHTHTHSRWWTKEKNELVTSNVV